jgi:hypothetical protein
MPEFDVPSALPPWSESVKKSSSNIPSKPFCAVIVKKIPCTTVYMQYLSITTLLGGAVNSTRNRAQKIAQSAPRAQRILFVDIVSSQDQMALDRDVLPADFRYDDTARFVTGSVHKVS